MAEFWEDDWEPFDYEPQYDAVDFDYELFGTTTRCEMYLDEDRGGSDQLSAGLCSVSGRPGQDWLDRNIRTTSSDGRARTTQEETTQMRTDDSDFGTLHPTSLHGMQVDGGDGRHTTGVDSVSILWPDPITGCVHGGHCALRFLSDDPGEPCQHPPILPSQPLHGQATIPVWREQTSTAGQGSSKFASFLRWQRLQRKSA